MTVRELKELLRRANPNLKVIVECPNVGNLDTENDCVRYHTIDSEIDKRTMPDKTDNYFIIVAD